jgi:hypothetical protein
MSGTMSLVVERYSASWSARSHIAARWGEIEDITGPSDTAAEAVDKLAEAIRARAEYMRETADAMLATLADGEGES